MEGGSQEYVRVVRIVDHETEAVWRLIADFGAIARWIDGVSDCQVTGSGVGSIRTVSIRDRHVRERLHICDPARHVLAYQVLPPHGLPASDIVSTLELSAAGPESTRIVWRSEAAPGMDANGLRRAVEPFFVASLNNLQRLLDQFV